MRLQEVKSPSNLEEGEGLNEDGCFSRGEEHRGLMMRNSV